MRPKTARVLLSTVRAAACALALFSAALTIWYVSTKPLPYDMRSSQVASRVSDCSGSFSSRYDCKSTILIGHDNRLFLIWLGRLAIVVAPLLVIYGAYRVAARRLEDEAEPPFRKPRSAAG